VDLSAYAPVPSPRDSVLERERDMRLTESTPRNQGPEGLSSLPTRLQIHQYSDPEILEFFNRHGVKYRLLGDHLFIIQSREQDVAAGPGDWLVIAPDGEVEVQRGDYALRAQRAITSAKQAREWSRRGETSKGPVPSPTR
jgi:hypothetical protein